MEFKLFENLIFWAGLHYVAMLELRKQKKLKDAMKAKGHGFIKNIVRLG